MFEFLFKYPAIVFQKGNFVWLAGWPFWLLIVAILAAAAGLAYLILGRGWSLVKGYRAMVIWGLQASLVALLLLMLWQPALSVSALKSQQNIVAVVVDDSKSMALVEDGTSRKDTAARIVDSDLINQLKKRFQVRLYKTGTGLARINAATELKSADTATHLGEGLKQIANEAGNLPIGAVVLMSSRRAQPIWVCPSRPIRRRSPRS